MPPLSTLSVRSRRRRAPSGPARRTALRAACLIVFMFAARAAGAAEPAHMLRDGDVRRAEKVLAGLRLLYGAAGADDAGAYRALSSKMFPGLFVTAAEIRHGDLGTDISTAVFLAEELGRTWFAAGAEAADCGRERPDIYLPLCLDLRGGTVRQLLLAKARLHASWAEALVRSYRGDSDAETARALKAMAAARAADVMIAGRVVETLRPLEEMLGSRASATQRTGQQAAARGAATASDAEFDAAMRAAGALLAWMPRSAVFYQLSGARLAYADGLSWYRKVRQSKRLVVAANGFERDPLKDLGLDAEQVSAAAGANWKTAARRTRLAAQTLSEATR